MSECYCGVDHAAQDAAREARAESANALALADALADATDGAIYCVTCWDNPEQNLCAKHLDPLRAALAAYREIRR